MAAAIAVGSLKVEPGVKLLMALLTSGSAWLVL